MWIWFLTISIARSKNIFVWRIKNGICWYVYIADGIYKYEAIQPGGLINFTFWVVIWFYGIEYQNAEWSIMWMGFGISKELDMTKVIYEFMVNFRVKSWVILRKVVVCVCMLRVKSVLCSYLSGYNGFYKFINITEHKFNSNSYIPLYIPI